MFRIKVKTRKIYWELLDENSCITNLTTVLCKKDIPSSEMPGMFYAKAGVEYKVKNRSKVYKTIYIEPEKGSTRWHSWHGYEVKLDSNQAFYKRRYRAKSKKKNEDTIN